MVKIKPNPVRIKEGIRDGLAWVLDSCQKSRELGLIIILTIILLIK